MKKLILFLFLAFLVVVVGGYLVLARNLDTLVVRGVNTYGPKLTQSKVELASASLSPLSGAGTLKGLSIGNPAGWSDGRAFYLGEVQVNLEPKSAMSDTIIINELVINQPEITYETRIVSSNIQDLLKNIEQSAGKGEKTEASGPPKKFIVKKFRLTNGKVTVHGGGKSLEVPLPEISLDNLGVAENGITGGQLAGAVMRDVLGHVVTAAAGAVGQLNLGDLSADKLKDAAKNVGDTVKKLFQKK